MSGPTGTGRPLLESAKQFLIEALHNYEAGKRSFAIVHAVTAVELLMKERLARIHPRLVLANIDRGGPRSVGMEYLPRRLEGFGLALTKEDEELVKDCVEWRNQIVHHFLDESPSEVSRQLPGLLDFAARFMSIQLEVELRSFIPPELYRTAAQILSEWEKAIAVARLAAEETGHPCSETCLRCGASGVLAERRVINMPLQVLCHFCGTNYVRKSCGCLLSVGGPGYTVAGLCNVCSTFDDDDGGYPDSLSDLRRGK